MSHYGNNTGGGGVSSWQSHKNTSNSSSNNSNNNSSNSSSGGGGGQLNINTSAANLIAQFANLNSLASLPALVANANAIQLQSNASGYQWHSQNRLAQQQGNNHQTSSSSSSNLSKSSNNSNGTGSMSMSKGSSSNYEPLPLMQIETQKRNQQKPVSNSQPGMSKSQDNSMSRSSSNSNSNSSRFNDSRNVITGNRSDSHTSRFSSASTGSSGSNAANSSSSSSSSSNVLASLTPNPLLAQALLSQIAQSAQNNSNTALLAATLAVAQQKQQQQQQQQQQQAAKPVDSVRRFKSRSRSNSPGRNRNHSRSDSTRISLSRTNEPKPLLSNTTPRRNSSRSRSPHSMSRKPVSSSTTTTTITTGASTVGSASKPAASKSSTSSRHAIKLPKYTIDCPTTNVSLLKYRYGNLYVPSDFTNSRNNWHQALPLSKPLKFNTRCLFHVMSKDAVPLSKIDAVYEPADMDHRWSVKVMLLAMPSTNELYRRCCSFAEDGIKDARMEHPSKVIEFLVGSKGKHELMPLGGPWSPSLDGPNPASNPQTLINTAVRTVKALTGIDLSPCTQWFRILDIQYNRNEDYKTINRGNSNSESKLTNGAKQTNNSESGEGEEGNTSAAEMSHGTTAETADMPQVSLNDDKYVETTVIFLPNVWSLMPTSIDYEKIVEAYRNFVDNPPTVTEVDETNGPSAKDVANDAKSSIANTTATTVTPSTTAPTATTPTPLAGTTASNTDVNQTGDETQATEAHDAEAKPLKVESETSLAGETNESGQQVDESVTAVEREPTHYSKLDLKKMKVDELRAELLARNLDTKGTRPQLLTRLKDALHAEKEKDDVDETQSDSKDLNNTTTTTANAEDTSTLNDSNNSAKVTNVGLEEDVMQMDAIEITKHELTIDAPEEKKSPNGGEAAPVKQPEVKKPPAKTFTRSDRERIYRLPSTPHIVVHPSSTAKNGKFECQLVTLSHLLDYRKDDNKECSFEVFLFAECFNEMLLRDNGFVIFKHLLSLGDDREAASAVNGIKRKLSDVEHQPSELKKSKLAEGESDSPATAADILKEDKTAIASSTSSTSVTSLKPKQKTIYPELLLAFSFFDTNRTNHILEKDLEDLLLLISLNLSRSKVRPLLKKLSFRDGVFNYRHLTDKLLLTTCVTPVPVAYKLPSDEEIVNSIISYDSFIARLKSGQSSASSGDAIGDAKLVEINGTVVDVTSALKKLDKAETSLSKLDLKLKDALDEIDRLRLMNKTSERNKQKLSDELNDTRKRLRDQQRVNKELDDKYLRVKDCLYRGKSSLNKLLDDIGDTFKKINPSKSSSDKTTDSSATVKSTSSGIDASKSTTSNSSKLSTADQTHEHVKSETADVKQTSNETPAPTSVKTATTDENNLLGNDDNSQPGPDCDNIENDMNENNFELIDGNYSNDNQDTNGENDDELNMDA